MFLQPPIWEPKGTRFRPNSVSTLIAFYIGHFLRQLFSKLKRSRAWK